MLLQTEFHCNRLLSTPIERYERHFRPEIKKYEITYNDLRFTNSIPSGECLVSWHLLQPTELPFRYSVRHTVPPTWVWKWNHWFP